MKSFGEWMNDMSGSIPDASEIKDKQEEVLFNPFITINGIDITVTPVNDDHELVYTHAGDSLPYQTIYAVRGLPITQPYDDDLATYMCGMLAIMPIGCLCCNGYNTMYCQFMGMDEVERDVHVQYFRSLLS